MRYAPSRQMLLALGLSLPALGLWPTPVRAEAEIWPSFETRIPVSDGEYGLPNTFRFYTEARYGREFPGIGSVLLRYGPMWAVHPQVSLGLNLTSNVGRSAADTVYDPELRLELEPNFFVRWGAFTLNDRSRLEHHWHASGTAWRYRNQCRLSYHPEGSQWIPFVGDEVFVEFAGPALSENRFLVGVGYVPADGVQTNLSLMARARAGDAGAWDHALVLVFGMLYSPKNPPVFELDGNAN